MENPLKIADPAEPEELKDSAALIAPEQKRNPVFDVVRGIAMLCVILIHTGPESYLGYGLTMLLYFAVPLYFLVSGYLLFISASHSRFWPYMIKRIKGLLLPYLIFFIVSFIWTQTVYAASLNLPMFGFPIDWGAMLRAFLFAGQDLFGLAVVPPPLWFLHALFLSSIVFYFLAKIKKTWFTAVIAFVLLAISLPIQSLQIASDYWIIGLLPVALFFMVCGKLLCQLNHVFIRFKAKVKQYTNIKENVTTFSSFLGLLFLFVSLRLMQNGRGDMWRISSEWYFLAALFFCGACYLFSHETKNAVFLFTGKHSLLYLGLHSLVLGLPFVENLPQTFMNMGLDPLAAFVAYFILVFLLISLLVIVCLAIKNVFLWVFQKPKSTEMSADG